MFKLLEFLIFLSLSEFICPLKIENDPFMYDCSNRKLRKIPINYPMENIRWLNISKNKITKIQWSHFPNLEYLDASFNYFEKIEIDNALKLTYLNLKNNRLQNIPKISSRVPIKTLNLAENLISHDLHNHINEFSDNLRMIDLRDNPFHINEKIFERKYFCLYIKNECSWNESLQTLNNRSKIENSSDSMNNEIGKISEKEMSAIPEISTSFSKSEYTPTIMDKAEDTKSTKLYKEVKNQSTEELVTHSLPESNSTENIRNVDLTEGTLTKDINAVVTEKTLTEDKNEVVTHSVSVANENIEKEIEQSWEPNERLSYSDPPLICISILLIITPIILIIIVIYWQKSRKPSQEQSDMGESTVKLMIVE